MHEQFENFGKFGGKVVRTFTGAKGKKYLPGATLTPEDVESWPLANRIALHKTGKIQWFLKPEDVSIEALAKESASVPSDEGDENDEGDESDGSTESGEETPDDEEEDTDDSNEEDDAEEEKEKPKKAAKEDKSSKPSAPRTSRRKRPASRSAGKGKAKK